MAATEAQLARIDLASDPDEIAGLVGRAGALRLMRATAAPASAQIEAEVESLRADYQRTQAQAAQLRLHNERDRGDAHVQLAELERLIAAPPAMGHEEMIRSYADCRGDLIMAEQRRMENWRREQAGLRGRLGLPPFNAEPPARATAKDWLNKLQDDAPATVAETAAEGAG